MYRSRCFYKTIAENNGKLGKARLETSLYSKVIVTVAARRRPLAAVGAEPRVRWNPRRPWKRR